MLVYNRVKYYEKNFYCALTVIFWSDGVCIHDISYGTVHVILSVCYTVSNSRSE